MQSNNEVKYTNERKISEFKHDEKYENTNYTRVDINDEDYNKKVNEIIKSILEAAFNSDKNLKKFLDSIVAIGADKLDAKSCAIFLLEESEENNTKNSGSRILRAYSTSGDVGDILKQKKAHYYVPRRKPFKNEGQGYQAVVDYLKDYYLQILQMDKNELNIKVKNIESSGESLIDALVPDISLMEVIDKMEDDLNDLVETGILPMGIGAFVVKAGESPDPFQGGQIRNHPEWRGSYERAHEICTSVIPVPLIGSNGILGMIRIENHKDGLAITNFNDLKNSQIFCFSEKHKEILTILANSVVIAIEDVLKRDEHRYKKLFGINLIQKIDKLEIENEAGNWSEANQEILYVLKKFYDPLKIEIDDIIGIKNIYNRITLVVNDIAQKLGIDFASEIFDNVGSSFEPLLGTDIRYREHFIHQFQVFLLGYYLINSVSSLREKLKEELDNDLDAVLKVWFIASMFHDVSYSVGKIEKWLTKYFERVKFPKFYNIDWNSLFTNYDSEKTELIQLISPKIPKLHSEISKIIKKGIIEEHDHGVLSALSLLDIFEGKIDETILTEASCAICLHTEEIYPEFQKGNENKLLLDELPFAFLLVFCDTVQQWGRPLMHSLESQMNVKLKDIQTDDNNISISLEYPELTEEQLRVINQHTRLPRNYWESGDNINFEIIVCEPRREVFGNYVFR